MSLFLCCFHEVLGNWDFNILAHEAFGVDIGHSPYSLFYTPQAPNPLFIPGNLPEVFCSNSDSLDWLCPSHSSTSLRSWLNVSLSSSSPSWAICAEVRNFETKSLPCATTCRACAHCTSLFPNMKSALMRTTSLSRRPVMRQQSIGPFLYQHRQPLIFSSHTDIDASMIVSEASQRFIRVQTFEVIDHGGKLRFKVIALQTVKLLSCEFLLRAQMHWYFKTSRPQARNAKVEVELDEVPYMPHAFQWCTTFLPEAREADNRIVQWMLRKLSNKNWSTALG